MRKLNDQWPELASDGKMHMYKAVVGPCERCDISHTCNLSVDCHMERGLIAKDLGMLNDDGLLPSSWGEYPTIGAPSEEGEAWCAYAFLAKNKSVIKKECAWGETEQEAIGNWNRRS